MEVMEYVTQKNPQIAKPYLETVISYLNDKAPRVKWEAGRVIANTAQSYPQETAKAISALLENAKDKGTVVRWSSALALSAIFQANEKIRSALKTKIENILKTEKNNGVRKIYLKTLK